MAGEDLQRANTRTVVKAVLVVFGMFGFGFAMVPMYSAVCQAFGLNGQTEQISAEDEAKLQVDKSRQVRVTFDANTNPRLPWRFKPLVDEVTIHPGERKLVSYEATNLSGSKIVGQAVHSVTPTRAAPYFKKAECFCYSQQALESGQTRKMPVVFMLDPNLPANIESVTLSYTFLRADKYAQAE